MKIMTFYSPNGNHEVWDAKPEGYFTVEEWEAKQRPLVRSQEILTELNTLDLRALRSLTSIEAGMGTDADTKRLQDIENQKVELRNELHSLRNPDEVPVTRRRTRTTVKPVEKESDGEVE